MVMFNSYVKTEGRWGSYSLGATTHRKTKGNWWENHRKMVVEWDLMADLPFGISFIFSQAMFFSTAPLPPNHLGLGIICRIFRICGSKPISNMRSACDSRGLGRCYAMEKWWKNGGKMVEKWWRLMVFHKMRNNYVDGGEDLEKKPWKTDDKGIWILVVPSGKRCHNYGKSACSIGEPPIFMDLAQADGPAQRLFDPLGNDVGNTNGSRWEHRRSDIRNIAIMTSRIIGFVSGFSLEIMGIFMDFNIGDLRPHFEKLMYVDTNWDPCFWINININIKHSVYVYKYIILHESQYQHQYQYQSIISKSWTSDWYIHSCLSAKYWLIRIGMRPQIKFV